MHQAGRRSAPTVMRLGLLMAVLTLPCVTAASKYVIGDTSVTYEINGSDTIQEKLTDTLYAKFSPSETIFGTVAVFKAKQSCKPPDPVPPQPARPTLMLAASTSNCTFTDQARVAQQYGMKGMIISDVDSKRGSVVLMTTDDKSLSFPAISCTPDVAARLEQLLADPGIRSMNMTVKPEPTFDFTALTLYTRTAIFVVLCIVLIFMSSVYCQQGLRRIFCRRSLERQVIVEQARFNDRATHALQQMELRTYHSGKRGGGDIRNSNNDGEDENEDDQPMCAICIEDLEDGDTLRRLPCRHEFHQACIDPWITARGTCPLCKANAVEAVEGVDTLGNNHSNHGHDHGNGHHGGGGGSGRQPGDEHRVHIGNDGPLHLEDVEEARLPLPAHNHRHSGLSSSLSSSNRSTPPLHLGSSGTSSSSSSSSGSSSSGNGRLTRNASATADSSTHRLVERFHATPNSGAVQPTSASSSRRSHSGARGSVPSDSHLSLPQQGQQQQQAASPQGSDGGTPQHLVDTELIRVSSRASPQ